MSLVKHVKHTFTSRWGAERTTIRWQLECNNCKDKFTRCLSNVARGSQLFHYCSDKCSQEIKWSKECNCTTKGCPKNVHIKSQNKKYCSSCQRRITRRLRDVRRRKEVEKFLGNKCVVCKETDRIYFQIDHVYNDATYSKSGSYQASVSLKDVIKEPKRYQLMCANCNHAKRMNGGKIYKPKKRR